MTTFRKLAFILFAILASIPAYAEGNLALIIANKDYRAYSDVRDAYDVTEATREMQQAGFTVKTVRNLNWKNLIKLAPGFRKDINSADRVLVVVVGQVVSSERESWLLTTDAPKRDGLIAGTHGLPIQSLMDLMGNHAGGAVLMVGYPRSRTTLVPGLANGFDAHAIPQGVTVISGDPDDLAEVLRGGLLVAGTSTGHVANSVPRGVTVEGFVSPMVAFLPPKAAPARPVYDSEIDELEQLIWDNARTGGSESAVQTYLRRYPEGRYAAKARALLEEFQKSPIDLARGVEEALGLSRDSRREIQRSLSLLGFNTRGVDGIFGRGTRAAVMAWQGSNGIEETGYLSGNQIAALSAQSAVRAEKLEEEARKRREEIERQDASFWRSTGRSGGEAGLRAYVKKYPDGLYSDIALDRLAVFDEERRRSAAIAEGNAWDVALEKNTIQGYGDFLNHYPNGAFVENAKAKIAALQESQGSGAEKQEEKRILSNPITRILVEQKLAGLGLEPGKVDGKIDDKTRKAVRRFQRAADLPVTGYVTQATIVRLLAAR